MSRLMLGGLILATLATGCGRFNGVTEAAGTPESSPRVVYVNAADGGKDVVLRLGDELVFNTVENLPPGLHYELIQVPDQQVRLISAEGAFPFRFEAYHAGVGMLKVSLGPCNVRGAGPACPLLGSERPGPEGMPLRLIEITVKVLARGAGQ